MVDTHEHMPKQITPADVGYALKAAREELGVSLVEISDKTRISVSYLEHIEAGRFDLLPSAAYVKGFLRNYCQVVHVDPAPLIEALREADSTVSEKPEYRFPVQALVPKMASSMMALIIVCFALGGYVFWVTAINNDTELGATSQVALLPNTASTESQLESQFEDIPVLAQPEAEPIAEPLNETASLSDEAGLETQNAEKPVTVEAADDTAIQTAQGTENETGDTLKPVKPVAVETEPALPSDDQQNIEIAESQAKDIVPPVAEPETLAQTATSVATVSEQSENALSSNGVAALATPRAPLREIIITATSASWLEIAKRDGEVLVSKLLRKGEKLVSAMDEELLLSTGNAGGLLVKTNEIEDFQLGKVGEILRDLPLSRDGMRTRYNLTSY